MKFWYNWFLDGTYLWRRWNPKKRQGFIFPLNLDMEFKELEVSFLQIPHWSLKWSCWNSFLSSFLIFTPQIWLHSLCWTDRSFQFHSFFWCSEKKYSFHTATKYLQKNLVSIQPTNKSCINLSTWIIGMSESQT